MYSDSGGSNPGCKAWLTTWTREELNWSPLIAAFCCLDHPCDHGDFFVPNFRSGEQRCGGHDPRANAKKINVRRTTWRRHRPDLQLIHVSFLFRTSCRSSWRHDEDAPWCSLAWSYPLRCLLSPVDMPQAFLRRSMKVGTDCFQKRRCSLTVLLKCEPAVFLQSKSCFKILRNLEASVLAFLLRL